MTSAMREPAATRLDPCDEAEAHPEDSEPIRLLVVDDTEDNRAILARRFMRRGFRVTEADSGLRALDILAGQEFDLVLLDVIMPDLNGVEVLEEDSPGMVAGGASGDHVHREQRQRGYRAGAQCGRKRLRRRSLSISLSPWRESGSRSSASGRTSGLARAHEALNTMNTDLERRVAERTRELAAINDCLKLEIVRRATVRRKDAVSRLSRRADRARKPRHVQGRRAARAGLGRLTRVPCAIFFIDLDGFKSINDTLGHSVGDGLLKALAARLRDRLPDDLLIARLGGDEFGILLSKCETADAVDLSPTTSSERSASRSRSRTTCSRSPRALASPSLRTKKSRSTSCSNALTWRCIAPRKKAAASVGPGTYRIFDPTMDEAAQSALRLSSEIRSALANSEFRLQFQPIVSVSERRISTFEALIRWQHPRLGLLGPNNFIPLAESKRYIVQIGEWVLREACREAMRWPEDIRVAVNLSPVEFQHGDVIAIVTSALAQSRIGAQPARTRDHRISLPRQLGAKHPHARKSARTRRHDLDGRLRHRLL